MILVLNFPHPGGSTSSNQGVRDVGNLNFKGAGIFDWFVTDLVQDDSGGDLAL